MLKNKIFVDLKSAVLIFTVGILLSTELWSVQPWTGLTKEADYSASKMKYFMHTGFMFDAVLRTAIFSYNLTSPVIAETEYDVIYLDKVIIPKGSELIGYADILKSGDRANVMFYTIVFPDGSEIPFTGLALHTDGSAGIPGKVKRYKERVPAKILLGTVGTVAGTAMPGVGGAVVQGLSGEALKEMEYKPDFSITVKKDTPLMIYNFRRIEY